MTPDAAAWVREQVWTEAMRATYGPWRHKCVCQWALSVCMDDAHDQCPLRRPVIGRTRETWVLGLDGWPVTTPRGRTWGRPAAEAQVWVTGCCATWRCRCGCHTAQSTQLALLETA